MADPEFSSLRSEFRSIEALLEDAVLRQSLLLSRLETLQRESPLGSNISTPYDSNSLTAHTSSTWSSVVKKRNRLSLPLFAPEDDDFSIPVSNFFAPLQTLQPDDQLEQPITVQMQLGPEVRHEEIRLSSPVERTAGPCRGRRKRDISPSSSSPSSVKVRKRCRCHSPSSVSGLENAFFTKHYSGEKSASMRDASLSNALMMTDDVIHLGSPSMFPNPVAIISRETTLPSGLLEPKSPVTCTLPANLAVFSYKDTLSPQLLLLGDSIVKEIRLPEAITYSLSDGKSLYMLGQMM
ncbi:unnamed protein product [Leuciscus chuanchicus]